MAKASRTSSKTRPSKHSDAAVQRETQEKLRGLEVELRRLKEELATVKTVIVSTANRIEELSSNLERRVEEISDQVRYASSNAAYAVGLVNGNKPDSDSLSSPLGPMSDLGAAPIDNRNLKRRS